MTKDIRGGNIGKGGEINGDPPPSLPLRGGGVNCDGPPGFITVQIRIFYIKFGPFKISPWYIKSIAIVIDIG